DRPDPWGVDSVIAVIVDIPEFCAVPGSNANALVLCLLIAQTSPSFCCLSRYQACSWRCGSSGAQWSLVFLAEKRVSVWQGHGAPTGRAVCGSGLSYDESRES